MRLSLESGQEWHNPSCEEVRNALRSLDHSRNDFAVLEREEDRHFMQVVRTARDRFLIEYQAGSADKHYRCTNTALTLDETVDAFVGYARRSHRWRTNLDWQKVELGLGWLSAGFFILMAISIVLLFWRGGNGDGAAIRLALAFVSVAFAMLAIDEIIRGRSLGAGSVYRSEHPVLFWMHIGFRMVVSIGLAGFLVADLLR